MKQLALSAVALAAALASQLAALPARAQQVPTPAPTSESGVAPSPSAGNGLSVVVTGRPIVEANQVDAYGSYSTRLVESQVQALSALDLTAALHMTPGVQISRYDEVGSYNGNQGGAVYIRGLGASRPGSEIKTYVDGVPV
jgi:iron complex outermembrane receptor protein